jgi:eukaryotic-like serine/threonine-protein kinase
VTTPDPLIGKFIAERYQILDVLGEGGMGRVYLAEHVRMGRRSALKVMSPNLALSADAISRFNREAANASKINHPNVAQIYDFGETNDGLLFLAMEFVEGETLRALLQRERRIPVARAATLVTQIAGALAAAHHLGIVHRDLKPDNIMIARHHDGSDWVKVVDFGIAKTVQGSGESGAGSQTVTTAGVSLGTPEYMSPEQLAGERLDNRTDLYSLGLVLFHMLTGDLPYPRVTSRETLVKRLTSRPLSLAEVAPDVAWPAGVQAALDRALAPELADRYETVVDFARDVAAAAAGPRSTAPTVRTPRLSAPTQRIAVDAPVPARRKAAFVTLYLSLATIAATTAVAVMRRDASPPQRPLAVVPETVRVAVPVPTAPATPVPIPTPVRKPEVKQAAAAVESLAPAPAARVDRASNRAPHNWLRANGDSGAARELPASASDADRIRYLVQEIRGHASRASLLLGKTNIGGMRAELRDLSFEVQTFRALFPSAADSLHLEQQVRATGMRLMNQCRTLAVDSTRRFPANFTCEQLLPGAGRGRRP